MQQKLQPAEEKFLIRAGIAIPYVIYVLVMVGYSFGPA